MGFRSNSDHKINSFSFWDRSLGIIAKNPKNFPEFRVRKETSFQKFRIFQKNLRKFAVSKFQIGVLCNRLAMILGVGGGAGGGGGVTPNFSIRMIIGNRYPLRKQQKHKTNYDKLSIAMEQILE